MPQDSDKPKQTAKVLATTSACVTDTDIMLLARLREYNEKITELQQENLQLKNNVAELEDNVTTLQQDNVALNQTIAELKEQLALAKQQKFGKSSETSQTLSPEGTGDLEDYDIPAADTADDDVIEVAAHTRSKTKKKAGRKIDTSKLKRQVFEYDIPETERFCPKCKNALVHCGQDSAEKLEIVPQIIFVVEHIKHKYCCKACNFIKMGENPNSFPMPKALAGASLIAEIVVGKYQRHIPLYRQSQILDSYDIDIPANTLGNWVMGGGIALDLLDAALWKTILSSGYLQADETPIKLLESDKRAYLWLYHAPQKNLVYFECSDTRSGAVAQDRLEEFKGILQTDGYSGYQKLRDRDDIIAVGCWAHCRRKFADVVKTSKNKKGKAAHIVALIRKLYFIEKTARDQGISAKLRQELRQKEAKPIVATIFKELDAIKLQVPPKSLLGKAIQYALNQQPYLLEYLNHGEVEIDNNLAENEIRSPALGRRNWLFMKSVESGTINARWYSLIGSAIQNGLNPRVYIHYVLEKVPEMRRGKIKPRDLLPDKVTKEELRAFVDAYVAKAEPILINTS